MYLCASFLYVLLDGFGKAHLNVCCVVVTTTFLPTAVERQGAANDDESTTFRRTMAGLDCNRHATAHGHEDESPTAQPSRTKDEASARPPGPPLGRAPCHKLTAKRQGAAMSSFVPFAQAGTALGVRAERLRATVLAAVVLCGPRDNASPNLT